MEETGKLGKLSHTVHGNEDYSELWVRNSQAVLARVRLQAPLDLESIRREILASLPVMYEEEFANSAWPGIESTLRAIEEEAAAKASKQEGAE